MSYTVNDFKAWRDSLYLIYIGYRNIATIGYNDKDTVRGGGGCTYTVPTIQVNSLAHHTQIVQVIVTQWFWCGHSWRGF